MFKTAFFITCAILTLVVGPAQAQQSKSFRDDFTGSSLAPEFRVTNHDPNRMTFVDGEYLLLITHKDRLNQTVYTGEKPEDYRITVRFSNLPEYVNQLISIYVGESENRVATGLYVSDWGGFRFEYYFNKFLNDESSVINVEVCCGKTDEVRPPYLRITKRGVTFQAAYSYNGHDWNTIGSHVLVRPPWPPVLEVANWGGNAPETAILVDFFEIVDLSKQ